jgi:flagellar L-ring protein precursor FlgH
MTMLIVLAALSGCSGLKDAREIKEAPMPPKYVEAKDKAQYASEGSLWKNSASMYEDNKARYVNDLVTIIISEQTSASKTATTGASGSSSADFGLTNIFGQDLNIRTKIPGVGRHLGLSPSVSGSSSSSFSGKGDTARTGTLTGTITAKVVEVLPNSNMVLESRKEIVVNNEKEILVFRGIVRPADITASNTVSSQYIADAQVYLVGDGVLGDKQSQGWLVKLLDKVWPF